MSWDHIAQLPSFLANEGGDLVTFKADHEAAYKQLPLVPGDQKNAIAALRDSSTKRRRGFVSRTLVFGSVYTVLRYNVISRIHASLTNRCLGSPLVFYFDDFAALAYRLLEKRDLDVFSRFSPS